MSWRVSAASLGDPVIQQILAASSSLQRFRSWSWSVVRDCGGRNAARRAQLDRPLRPARA
jgi:hypothetical protein